MHFCSYNGCGYKSRNKSDSCVHTGVVILLLFVISRSNVTSHYNSRHLKIRFKCHKCEITLSNRSNLLRHLKTMHNPHRRKHLCPLCSYRHARYDLVRRHTRRSHFVCRICNLVLFTRDRLKRHMQTHNTLYC